jgi:ribonuclease PH
MRPDNRGPEELRPLSFELGYLKFAPGSCLAKAGETRVLAACSFEPKVPLWLEGKAQGWITAEYAMLPASTPDRNPRESRKGRPSARSQEISRLIGRSLRMGFDLAKLGENTLIVDTDVLQADGGTRTLAVCAGFCALYQACRNLQQQGLIQCLPLRQFVAAVSVGIKDAQVIADLSYEEDSRAEVDANIVGTEDERIIELQLTAEREPVTDEQLAEILNLGKAKIAEIVSVMKDTLCGRDLQ